MSIFCFRSETTIKKYPPHTHAEWEIVCQLEGDASVTVNNEPTYHLTPRDILLIPPNAVRKGSSENGFYDLTLRSDALSFSSTACIHDTTGNITALLLMIEQILTERRNSYSAVAEGLLEAVRRMILQEIGFSCSPEVEQLKQTLYQNLASLHFQISDCLEETGYHKNYFRRRFKKETGKTPHQYLTELRIAHAKQLLADEHRFSIDDVAESCGFSDSFYFSTCFKKHIGLSPSEYRRTVQKK